MQIIAALIAVMLALGLAGAATGMSVVGGGPEISAQADSVVGGGPEAAYGAGGGPG